MPVKAGDYMAMENRFSTQSQAPISKTGANLVKRYESIPVIRLRHNVECARNPYPVASVRVPVVAGRSEVAEMDHPHGLLPVVFQIGSENHRHLEVQPAEGFFG